MKVINEFEKVVMAITRDKVEQGGNRQDEPQDCVYLSPGYWWSPGHYPDCLKQERGPHYAERDARGISLLVAVAPEICRVLQTAKRTPELVELERKILNHFHEEPIPNG